jgi:hypothetical protein
MHQVVLANIFFAAAMYSKSPAFVEDMVCLSRALTNTDKEPVETQDAAYFENGRAVNINVRGR